MYHDNDQLYQSECAEKSVFIDAISYLIYLKNPWKISSSNPTETISCLGTINEINFRYSDTFGYLSYVKKLEFIDVIFDYLKYMHEHLNENLQKEGNLIPVSQPPPSLTSTTQRAKLFITESTRTAAASSSNNHSSKLNLTNELEILHKMSLIIWSWADKSADFCQKVHDTKSMKVLFKYLANAALIGNVLEHVRTNNSYFKFALTFRALVGMWSEYKKKKEKKEREPEKWPFEKLNIIFYMNRYRAQSEPISGHLCLRVVAFKLFPEPAQRRSTVRE